MTEICPEWISGDDSGRRIQLRLRTPYMKSRTILSIGELLWDLFPDGPRFGGAAANFACHAALLGGRVFMVSAVGDDANGREARRILESLSVDTSLVQSLPGTETGAVTVKVDAAGKPSFRIHEDVAWDHIAWSDALAAQIAGADAVYFGTLAQRGVVSRATIRRAMNLAAETDVPRVLDVNLRSPFFDDAMIRESVALCSIMKISDEELPAVLAACGVVAEANAADSLRAILDRYDLALVAMTRGADGALLVSREESVDQPGIPTTVVDTVGAGDSFTAALITGLLDGRSLSEIARKACEVAAAVCAQPGAVPQR